MKLHCKNRMKMDTESIVKKIELLVKTHFPTWRTMHTLPNPVNTSLGVCILINRSEKNSSKVYFLHKISLKVLNQSAPLDRQLYEIVKMCYHHSSYRNCLPQNRINAGTLTLR